MTAEKPKFYTLRDLQEQTGFDGRTIYFYVQEGLVPKLGRRGRTSIYPQAFLDRLLFIKKLKAFQDSGEIGPITLQDIRRIMETVPAETVARVASGEEPLQAVEVEAWEDYSPPAGALIEESAAAPDDLHGDAGELRRFTLMQGKHDLEFSGGSIGRPGKEAEPPEEWTTLSVTDDIMLTVRGKDAGETPLVQTLIQLIRGVVGKGG